MRFREFSKFKIRPHLFENKQQYKQIVDTVLNSNLAKGIASKTDYVPDGVRKDLKRADRIMWWLRWWRKWVLQTALAEKKNKIMISDELTLEEQNDKITELENEFKKITKTSYTRKVIDQSMDFLGYFSMDKLDHWISMFPESPQINEVEWKADLSPRQLLRELERAEEEWREKQEQEIEMKSNDQVIIDYGKYAWVKLDRAYCELEGRAMGHCGNTATPKEGDRILSFRSKVAGEKQRPHLTFILDKDGYLGEMKGRANEKPSERYHSYIIDLLQKDFIKGIKGGGYLPESNFSITDLDQEQLNKLISVKPNLITPKEAYLHAVENGEGGWPAVEEIIAQSPEYAFYYAQEVIKGRFPEGEEAIAQYPRLAYYYARYVIEGRFPAGEDAMAQDPEVSIEYAFDVIKKLEGKNRWPDGEEVIAQDAESAHFYAQKVIGGRFPAGEAAIARDPIYALDYSIRLIKDRFPEPHRATAESVIKRQPGKWKSYTEFVKQRRSDES